ncbi:MAG: hypothetical protein NTY09_01455 [bacterium]|nr:hypothetical protein [bacterium]
MKNNDPYILHLTARPDGWGAKRFREASKKLDVKLRTADPSRALLETGPDGGVFWINGRKLQRPGCILPRFGPGNYENGLALNHPRTAMDFENIHRRDGDRKHAHTSERPARSDRGDSLGAQTADFIAGIYQAGKR